ncbi:MAG TPA: glycosyltransferase family 1 protein [Methanophagales archaeon]|nr:glycosyltransferase family 1 protein [Methanophagales archaeon]
MKILHIFELGPLDNHAIGGIEVAILELCKELVSLGNDVTIMTGAKNSCAEHYIAGVRILPVDCLNTMRLTWSNSNLKLSRQALFPLAMLRQRLPGYDIYHGHIYVSGLIASYLARINNAVAVNTLHGSYYPVWDIIANSLAACFYQACERFLAPTIARHVHLQIHTAEYFAEQVQVWGASADRLKVIHNGVNLDNFFPGVEPIEHEHSLPVVLTARRLVRKNGVEYLIRAMKHVLREEQCKLIVIGDGPERQKLESLSLHLGVSEHVEFVGAVPHNHMPQYISAAEVVVVPSLIEASSLFALEAMAMAKPIVATRVGGLPETLGNAALFVEPMNERALSTAILQLLQDERKKKILGKKGCWLAQKRSWEIVAKQTDAEYRRIMSSGD